TPVDAAPPARVAPKPRRIKKATKLINKSKRPVMIIGTGAKDAKDEVKEFIEAVKIPSIITLPAKGILADAHPYNLGNLCSVVTKVCYQTIQDVDLLIMVVTNYPYVDYLPKKNIIAIQNDTNPENIGHRFDVNAGIIGDSKLALQQLTDSAKHVKNH